MILVFCFMFKDTFVFEDLNFAVNTVAQIRKISFRYIYSICQETSFGFLPSQSTDTDCLNLLNHIVA